MIEVQIDEERPESSKARTENSGGWLYLAPSVLVDHRYYRHISMDEKLRRKSITGEVLLLEVTHRDNAHDSSDTGARGLSKYQSSRLF